jgi:hypothetical protein
MSYGIGIFAYIGPDAMLPMTSVIATIVGLTLMFGRYVFQKLARVCRMIAPRPVQRALRNHLRPRRGKAAMRQVAGEARADGA